MSNGIYRIGAIIPQSGTAGIYGPSCKSCLTLAQNEINEKGGISGHRVEIAYIDGNKPASVIGREVQTLLDTKALHALIGMHDSDIRKTVAHVNKGRVIYIYTPGFEGGHRADGLICFGETPSQQIRPAMEWLRKSKSIKSWCFIGSDFSWPRQLRTYLKTIAKQADIEIKETYFVEPGTTRFGEYLDGMEEAKPDAVFFALVGDEAVQFNRSFGRREALKETLRFGPLFEENTLLAVGEDNAQHLYTAGGYFSCLDSPENIAFKEKYFYRSGANAPEINMLSVSSYSALHLLADILPSTRDYNVDRVMAKMQEREVSAPIGRMAFKDGSVCREIFMAEAIENQLQIVNSFGSLQAY